MNRTRYLLAMDQGTSSSRSIVFDAAGQIVAMAQREFRQLFPRPGWVEHDPMEIWQTQLATARDAILSPTLKRVAGAAGATEGGVTMAGEDFSRFSALAPGFFFNLSVTPPNLDPKSVASNHSPLFQGDDRALPVGVRAMSNMAMDFLRSGGVPKVIP